MVEMRLSGVSGEALRAIAATLHSNRDSIATHNQGGGLAPHWAPTVHCEGPHAFTVFTPAVSESIAVAVLKSLSQI